ncbi:MAG: hypothetical protein ACFE9S_07300 [Candidatus Hermodarchaeota archaeon]
MKKTFQINPVLSRLIVILALGILALDFSIIAFQILRRKRQRFHFITSGFYISLSIGFVLNLIYAAISIAISNVLAILILNFLTNFFIFFGVVFLFIVNMIILESTLIYSIKRQNRYIMMYGILLFAGMLILVLIGLIFDSPTHPFLGVQIINNAPQWGLIFFIYIVLMVTGFCIVPITYTNFKIYFRLETKALKRKWVAHLVGFLGLSVDFYLIIIYNLLDPVAFSTIRSIISISFISVVLWGYLMYRGIGIKLRA